MTLRPADERGHLQRDWMEAYHSFSFGTYQDPEHMGFGVLRVINDDWIAPGGGFPAHGHDNMEIITYMVRGSIEHWDSSGGAGIIGPGDLQFMSAGTGIRHSEYNASQTEDVRLFQIWIHPDERGLVPRYERLSAGDRIPNGDLLPVVTPEGGEGEMRIDQDARLLIGRFDGDDAHVLEVAEDRRFWVQVVEGTLTVGDQALEEGDGLAIEGSGAVEIRGGDGGHILVFDLPG